MAKFELDSAPVQLHDSQPLSTASRIDAATNLVSLHVNSKFVVHLVGENIEQALVRLNRRLNAPLWRDGPETIAFMNMCNFKVANEAPKALSAFAGIDHVYPDGVALQIARTTLKLSPFQRVSGTDLVPRLLETSRKGLRVFLLGGKPEFVTACATGFECRFPSLNLVGIHHGYFASEECSAVISKIAAARPDLLLIGMGTPAQELWLTANRQKLPTKLAICVGGLFHYWAGDLRRAPRLWQRLGLEWIWILAQQPEKWRSYFTGAIYFSRWLLHQCWNRTL
jgi:N-acetylglucosaminyldiphosphoundecaprenol N-acetyl-beta-D-mannosaminyltransferase